MKLYGYWRSSATYRVRIALNLKGMTYDTEVVNLLKGEQKSPDYSNLNPQQKVPTLVDDKHVLTQSLAIIEYLEELQPHPPLLPQTAPERARVRALAQTITTDIAPLNNLGPMQYLTDVFKATDEQKNTWYAHWLAKGFAALEELLAGSRDVGHYCHRDTPGMADCCLVPQVYNARRYNFDLSPYPTIMRISEACEKHPAFIAAHPSKQPDAV